MLQVCDSDLPSHLRHMLMVYALHGKNETGRGWSGQRRIAQQCGWSVKTHQRYLEELEGLVEAGKSPVRLVFKRRGRKGEAGGQTSPVYDIELASQSDTAVALNPGDESDSSVALNPPFRATNPETESDNGVALDGVQSDSSDVQTAKSRCEAGTSNQKESTKLAGPPSAGAPGPPTAEGTAATPPDPVEAARAWARREVDRALLTTEPLTDAQYATYVRRCDLFEQPSPLARDEYATVWADAMRCRSPKDGPTFVRLYLESNSTAGDDDESFERYRQRAVEFGADPLPRGDYDAAVAAVIAQEDREERAEAERDRVDDRSPQS